jgi:hypothetical protein
MKLQSSSELAQVVFMPDWRLRKEALREHAKVRAGPSIGASRI